MPHITVQEKGQFYLAFLIWCENYVIPSRYCSVIADSRIGRCFMQTLLAPENLFFELPLLLAITLTIMQLIGGLEAGHAVHADVSHTLSHDMGHDASHEHTTDHEHGHHGIGRGFARVLGFFGMGNAPAFMVVAAFCYCWAFIGFASMRLLPSWLPAGVYVWWSVVITLLLTVFATRYLARTLGFLFRTESYGVAMSELVGS